VVEHVEKEVIGKRILHVEDERMVYNGGIYTQSHKDRILDLNMDGENVLFQNNHNNLLRDCALKGAKDGFGENVEDGIDGKKRDGD
jgi:hypothetical protein